MSRAVSTVMASAAAILIFLGDRGSRVELGHTTVGRENLENLTDLARYVAELANLPRGTSRSSARAPSRTRAAFM